LLLVIAVEKIGATAAIMTPLQLFRCVLQLLADKLAWSKGLALTKVKAVAAKGQQQQQQVLELGDPPALAAFRKQYAVVLLDHTGWYNAAAGVSASCFGLAAAEAQRSLGLLAGKGDPLETFGALLCTPRYADGIYDYVWHVTLPQQDSGEGLEGDVSKRRTEELRVEGLVRTALGDRASLVRALPRAMAYSSSSSSREQIAAAEAAGGGPRKKQKRGAGPTAGDALGDVAPKRQSIFIGAFVDPQNALRLVDVGPAANDTAAAEKFRGVWGDKSELRRFQDGKICEAVVWEVPPDSRHQIPDLAVEYILRRHLPAGVEVCCCVGHLDTVLSPAGNSSDTMASRSADAALTKLSKQLRGLTDVALKVVGVQPLSAASRHTPGFYPRPHPLAGGGRGLEGGGDVARCLEPLEVMVQLEGTGKSLCYSFDLVVCLCLRSRRGYAPVEAHVPVEGMLHVRRLLSTGKG
jgi:U3 small nucleolar RNA-associated protein 22